MKKTARRLSLQMLLNGVIAVAVAVVESPSLHIPTLYRVTLTF